MNIGQAFSIDRRSWPLLLILVVIAFGAGLLFRSGGDGAAVEHAAHGAEAGEPSRWTCSMHPQIILPSNDQKCPICFMDLIPLEEDQGGGLEPGDLRLSEAAAALAEVTTVPVQRRQAVRELRLVGKVAPDEARVQTITARVGGRLEYLHVDATGIVVRSGDPLADIYSPELYMAQAELRSAQQAVDAAADPAAIATLEATVSRLRLLGLGDVQIAAMRDGQAAADRITVTAPLGGVVVQRRATRGDYVKTGEVLYAIADLDRVWVTLDALESDIPWLQPGQSAAFTTRAWPGETFAGEVLFVDPVLDERTRSVEVRLAVDNGDGRLKPGMLVSAVVESELSAPGLLSLVIPATAPLLTGTRAVVYVRLPGEGDPVFRGRQVVLGPRAGDWYVVERGLEEGELVVVRGAFKIDSALQIQAQPSMMNASGVGAMPHDHGGHREHHPADSPAPEPLAVSDCLRADLAAVLETYLPLQTALAGDDDGAARAAAQQVRDRLATITCDDVPPSTVDVWAGYHAELNTVAAAVASADGIAARRIAFEPLSDGLWTVFERFGVGEVRPVRRYHCPMALDGDGANWLQDGKTTANPYYGASMLRCGSQVAELGDPADEEGN